MSSFKKSSQQKKNEECLMLELSSVLSVRAEQIRKRLLTEREADNSSALADKAGHIDVESSNRPVVNNPDTAPLSQARLRRQRTKATSKVASQAISQILETKFLSVGTSKQLKGASNVDIKNYRPGYTWSKGGRMKELRIRCLARKYFLLWYKKTYGRVPLSVAMSHHNAHLVHKYFYTWHSHWWMIAKEWRLGVRADCHYRFKVRLFVFQKWRQYVLMRHKSVSKLNAASDHFNQVIIKKAWMHWKHFISLKNNQSVLKKRADNFWHKIVVRNAWTLWVHKNNIMKQREENHSMAMEFWALRIQTQFWLQWKNALEMRQQQQERYFDAGVYYNSVLASKCLKAWTLYIFKRKVKKTHYGYASQIYCANLKLRLFNHWYQRWHLICSLQQHQKKIDSLSVSFRKRWVLWRWKLYVSSCKERRQKEALADHYHNCQLLRFGLDSFHLHVVHSHIKVMRSQLAKQLREKQIQRWAWLSWTSALERKEEVALHSKTEYARKHYNSKIMSKCFLALVNYAHWRRLHKSQYIQAEAHFYLYIMPKCLFHMRLFVELEKTCRENADKASRFKKLTMLRRTFQFWSKASENSKNDRMIHRMAILHRESVITQTVFTLWRDRARAVQYEAEKVVQAKEYYLLSVRAKAWLTWRNFVKMKRTSALNLIKAIRHHHLKQLKTYIKLWRKWVQNKNQKRIHLKKAETHHNLKILQACISEWKSFTLKGRRFRSVANVKYQEHTSHCLRLAFSEWHCVTKYLASRRRKTNIMIIHYNRSLLGKVMHNWHSYSVVRSYSRAQANELLNDAVKHLQQIKLIAYFKKWKSKKKTAVGISQKLDMADNHYHKCISKKVMESWIIYWRMCLRKKLLARQCQWFHDVRINAKYFLIWKGRLAEQREEATKSHLALWHWSLLLQQKVLQAWKAYIDIRKHKKSRMMKAAEIYRQQLLREACCQWLATADSLSQIRAVTAARHQAKAAFDKFQLIQKCALHWKTWTKTRASSSAPKLKTDTKSALVSSIRINKNTSDHLIAHQLYSSSLMPACPVEGAVGMKPQLSVLSPLRPFYQDTSENYLNVASKQRPPPKRPAFLVDSLKRAGLYSSVLEHTIDSAIKENNTLMKPPLAAGQDVISSGMRDSVSDGKFGMNVMKNTHSPNFNMEQNDISTRLPIIACNTQISPSTNLYLSSFQVPNINIIESLSTVQSEETNTLNRLAEVYTSGEIVKKCHLISGTTQVGINDLKNKWMENGKPQLMSSYKILNEKLLHNQQDNEDIGSVVSEESLTLLKPEDFMSKPPAVFNKTTVKPNSVLQPSYTKSGYGDHNVTKHLQFTPDSYNTNQNQSDQKSRLFNSSSNINFSKESSAPQKHKSKLGSQNEIAFNGDPYNIDMKDNNRVAALSSIDYQNTYANFMTSEEELIQIRDKLQLFTLQKQKLRTLRKQYCQLSESLKVAPDYEDTENMKKELNMMKLEITDLQTVVNSHRPLCEKLVKRTEILAQELQNPFK